MQNVFLVHIGQSIQYRQKNSDGVWRCDHADFGKILFQTLSLQIFHDHIGSAVFAEKVLNSDNAFVAKLSQGSRFFQKTIQAVFKDHAILLGVYRNRRRSCAAPRDLQRQILLNRHLGFQLNIPAQIGNSKATRFS